MGNSTAKVEATSISEKTAEKKPLKPCCACPETKKVRDEWVTQFLTVNLLLNIADFTVQGNRLLHNVIQVCNLVNYTLASHLHHVIITKGEAECGHLIEAHKACMRYLGFNI